MSKTWKVRVKQLRDTESNWTSKNPVLLAGEMAFSSDKNGIFKVGDGKSKWSELKYAEASSISWANVVNRPTKLSQFTNDSGYITGITKAMVTGALGYTPPEEDTNTWRPIVDNLTSDSTFSSLSANQGRALKELIDGKQPAGNYALKSEIPTTLPASDVYAWAKASTKPSYSWSEIGSRPTALSSFTNDKGYITGITKAMVTGALGYIPPTSDTDTWRDVVDGLESTRTDASLSANQGKVLNEKIDGIEIGGRNLILNSYDKYSNCSFLGDGNSFDIITTTCPDQTYGKVARITTNASTYNTILRIRDVVQTNDTYTLSVWCKSAESTDVHGVEIDICDQGKSFTATTSWQKQTLTATITNQSSVYQFVDFEVPNGHSVLFWHPKLEKGNKATDWTLAQEDLVGLVNEVSNNCLPLHGTAVTAASVKDYGNTTKQIQIGFQGSGITGDDIKYIAGYTDGDGGNLSAKIKDISKDALKAWLGLGSRAYDSTNYLPLSGGDLNGTLHVKPTTGSYTEGIRVYAYNGWSTVMLNGTDNTGTSGTSDKSWGLFNNDGQFYITKNGANTSPTAIFSNTDGTWRANGHELITAGNIGSQNVNYANSAGRANSVAWGNVSGRPSSLPASDVYAWAKASSKPSYSWSEITNKPAFGTAATANKGDFATAGHTHNYLPLSGGTITGRIVKNTSGSWIGDRDRAVVYSAAPADDSYGCVACMPTKYGSWSMGNLGGVEHLIFNYVPDANYSANKNESIHVYLRPTEGTIALTKDIPTTLPASDVYAWAKASSKPSYSWGEISGRPSSLPANGGTADYSNKVYATSHPGTWYLDTSWDGTYFQSCFKNGNSTLPMRVANANYADSAGSAGSANSVAWGNVSGRPSSLPASDVYAWAKASSKPSYSWGEISGRPTALSSFTNDSGFITGISKSSVTDALGYSPAKIRSTTYNGTMATSAGDGGRIGTAKFTIPNDKSGKSVRIIHLESNYSLTTCGSPSTSGTTVSVSVHSDTITSGNPPFGGRVLYVIEGEF